MTEPDRQDGDGLLKAMNTLFPSTRRRGFIGLEQEAYEALCKACEVAPASEYGFDGHTRPQSRGAAEGVGEHATREALDAACLKAICTAEDNCACARKDYVWRSDQCEEDMERVEAILDCVFSTSPPQPAPDAMREALEKLRAKNAEVVAGRNNYRPLDHLQIINAALSAPVPPADGAMPAYEKRALGIIKLATEQAEEIRALSPSPAVAAEPAGALAGLDKRLDRLLLTATDGNNFILSTDSAKNIVGIVREWIRVKSVAPPVRGDREIDLDAMRENERLEQELNFAFNRIADKDIAITRRLRGDREAIARIINPQAFDEKYMMKGRMREQQYALKRADVILLLHIKPMSNREAFYSILSRSIPSDMIDTIWQDLKEAGVAP